MAEMSMMMIGIIKITSDLYVQITSDFYIKIVLFENKR